MDVVKVEQEGDVLPYSVTSLNEDTIDMKSDGCTLPLALALKESRSEPAMYFTKAEPDSDSEACLESPHSGKQIIDVKKEKDPLFISFPVMEDENYGGLQDIHTLKQEVTVEEHDMMQESASNLMTEERPSILKETAKSLTCNICKNVSSWRENLIEDSCKRARDNHWKCETNGHVLQQMKHTGLKPFKCDICGKGFSERGKVSRHRRTHTGEKPFRCDLCGKVFLERGKLVIHQRTHTGEKPLKCDICGKRFSDSGNVVRHQKSHSGEKPFKCDSCGKGFSERGKLLRHQRTHSGEKPYKCDICGKCFSERGNLVTHERTHTGEKPFKCNTCGKDFSERGNLVKHQRAHKGEKIFK